MDRYRVVLPKGYLSSVASASPDARDDLVDLIRRLSGTPRRAGRPVAGRVEAFVASQGRVMVGYVVRDYEGLVGIEEVVVAD